MAKSKKEESNGIIDYSVKFQEFRKTLDDKTLEELEKMEQVIIKEADDAEKENKELVLNLPAEGRAEVFAAIRHHLSKGAYQWKYCLGALKQYELWENDVETVKFPELDATLRVLGEMQFKGVDEWRDVELINKYFECVRTIYVNATNKIYYIAECHSAIMSKMDLFKAPQDENPTNDTQQINS